MKKLLTSIFTMLMLCSVNAFSDAYSGYTSWAVPSQFEIIDEGIAVYGEFGKPRPCANPNIVHYANTYADYNIVVSMVMAAVTAKKELKFYIDDCKTISFHGFEALKAKSGTGIYYK